MIELAQAGSASAARDTRRRSRSPASRSPGAGRARSRGSRAPDRRGVETRSWTHYGDGTTSEQGCPADPRDHFRRCAMRLSGSIMPGALMPSGGSRVRRSSADRTMPPRPAPRAMLRRPVHTATRGQASGAAAVEPPPAHPGTGTAGDLRPLRQRAAGGHAAATARSPGRRTYPPPGSPPPPGKRCAISAAAGRWSDRGGGADGAAGLVRDGDRAALYSSGSDSARASAHMASWCLRTGMLMKLRASSRSMRCCGVARNAFSLPMPSKK